VPWVAEPEAEADPYVAEIGTTGTTGVVVETGTTEVGKVVETPALDNADETALDTPDGRIDETAAADGTTLWAVAGIDERTEAIPLEAPVGTSGTGMMGPVEEEVEVETEVAVEVVEVPRMVERPTTIPVEVPDGTTDSLDDKEADADVVMAGMMLVGRRPVDEGGNVPVDVAGVATPLVSDFPEIGMIGGITPVDDDDDDAGTLLAVVLDPATDSAALVAALTEVDALDATILVETTVDPRLFVVVRTTDDGAEEELVLANGVTVEPGASTEGVPLETGAPEVDVLEPDPEVGTEEATTTGDDSTAAVLEPDDATDGVEVEAEVTTTEV
jgi:hypothetical protein